MLGMDMYGDFQSVGKRICRFILGTSFGRSLPYDDAVRLFDSYWEAGGNCFDTALVYYDSEALLGRWIRDRRCRDAIVLLAKGAHPDGALARVSPQCIRDDIRRSLTLLQTDYVDVFMLHRDDPSQPVGPIIDELARAQAAGTIRAFAASNWTIPRLEAAARYAGDHNLPTFVASSVYYSLAIPSYLPWPGSVDACDRRCEKWYEITQMPLLAWSSLGFGYLTHPIGRQRATVEVGLPHSSSEVDLATVFADPANELRVRRLHELADSLGVGAAETALAWVLQQPVNGFAVAGPRHPTEVRRLFRAFAIALSQEQRDWLACR